MAEEIKLEELKYKELLSIKELAVYLGVNRCLVTKLQKQENFPKPALIMSKKKWKKSDIEAYIESTKK